MCGWSSCATATKLRVVYAIGTVDFQVPTLSLQTLVENAIRHGVSPRPEGGLVVVNTERGDGDATDRAHHRQRRGF